MRVLITGGAGFIGANLARELCAAGDDVVVIDDLSTGNARNLDGLDVDLRVGTILDQDLLDSAATGVDAIVHLAAIPSVPLSVADPVASHHANITGTLMVLEAARRAGDAHVTVASSSAVYGSDPELPKHEGMRCLPVSPYGVGKLAAEAYAIAFTECYGLPTLALRFFNVFGPLQHAGHAYAAVIPAFVDAAIAGRPLPLEGDGSQTRDFVYVGTVVKVLATAARRRVVSPTPVNLALRRQDQPARAHRDHRDRAGQRRHHREPATTTWRRGPLARRLQQAPGALPGHRRGAGRARARRDGRLVQGDLGRCLSAVQDSPP